MNKAPVIGESRKIKVTFLATQNLICDQLRLLLESNYEVRVLHCAHTTGDLVEKVASNPPDVVLLCLMENEEGNIEVIPELFENAPNTKVLILSNPESALDEPRALKLGATGIINANQSHKTLFRAIKQIAEGETWLNPKLVAQLLGKTVTLDSGRTREKGFYRNDDLTKRELEVVKMIGLGMKNRDISQKLFISEATVRHHLSSIYGKTDVTDRLNLVIYAYQKGLIPPPARCA